MKTTTNVLVMTNPLTWVGIAFAIGLGFLLLCTLILKHFWDEFTGPIEPGSPIVETRKHETQSVFTAKPLPSPMAGIVAPVMSPPDLDKLTQKELVGLVKQRGVRGANERWKRETLIAKLAA